MKASLQSIEQYTSNDHFRPGDGKGDDDDESSEFDASYVSEEDSLLISSALSGEEDRNAILELVHSRNYMKWINAELQMSLRVTEASNFHLSAENDSMRDEIEGMKQTTLDAEKLMDERDEIRGALAEKELAYDDWLAFNKDQEKDNEILNNLLEAIANEMSETLPERQWNKERIMNLKRTHKALQAEMKQCQFALDEKDEVISKRDLVIDQLEVSVAEYSANIQDLRGRLKHLEDELELTSLIESGGIFQYFDGFLSLPTQQCISLREELALATGLDQSAEAEEAEKHAEIQEALLYPETFRETNVRPEDGAPVKTSWFGESFASFKRGALAVGKWSRSCLLPLGFLSIMLPADMVWNTAKLLIQPCCTVHQMGLPPV